MKIIYLPCFLHWGVNTLLEKVNVIYSLNNEKLIFKDNSVEFLVPRKKKTKTSHAVRNPELQTAPY